jgi:Fur family ferric uptake transcriptional regulator
MPAGEHDSIEQAHDRLNAYLSRRGLRQTKQREAILESFFAAEGHVSSEELHERVRKRNPEIGAATVYRTLKLLVEAGVARASTFQEGVTVYERAGEHHDHLICQECGEIIEFECDEIERLQSEIARRHGYRLTGHRHHLFGYCPSCQGGAPGPVSGRSPGPGASGR